MMKTPIRRQRAFRRTFALSLLFIALLAFTGAAQTLPAPQAVDFSNFQPSAYVLGQPDFRSNAPGMLPDQLSFPYSIAVDPTTGKVFVSVAESNRVVRFSSAAALANGSAAEAILGEPNFRTTYEDTTQNKMRMPLAVAVDAGGRLWVADTYNHRILRFDNASSKANGANADGVLGQSDFNSRIGGNTPDKMGYPSGLFADSAGRLWVVDQINSRVLRFDDAAAKPNGAPADGILGTTGKEGTTRNTFYWVFGVTGDSHGRLYVSESYNNRVLRFDDAAAKANGADADAVFGQPDFTTGDIGIGANKMNYPTGIAVDENDRLYVADCGNRRVLIFSDAGTASNGADASRVLGQPDFTSDAANNGGVSAASMNNPMHIFFDRASSSLFVADARNNRVMRFIQSTEGQAAVSGKVSSGRKGMPNVRVRLTDEQGNVFLTTTDVRGRYRFDSVPVGKTYLLKASVKRLDSLPRIIHVTEQVSDFNLSFD